MTRSFLLAQLMTLDYPTVAKLCQLFNNEWRPVMLDLIELDLVEPCQFASGIRGYRVHHWHPTATYTAPGPDTLSLKARGMLREKPGYRTQVQAAYREWRLYA